MIRSVLIGPIILAAGIGSAANAEAEPWALAPACPPGSYTNPDDLSGPCLPGTPGNDYVAMAVSPSTGLGGWGMDDNQEGANQIALAQCVANTNSVCQVVAEVHNGCVAYADNGEAIRGGTGADVASASADALSTLPGGQVMGVECSRP